MRRKSLFMRSGRRAALCGLLCFALLAPASFAHVFLFAQSGRRAATSRPAKQTPTRQQPASNDAQRPRRAADETTPEPNATPPASPSTTVPASDTSTQTPAANAPATSAVPANKSAALPAAAGSTEPVEVGPEDVIRINSNLVTIPASIVDNKGKAIADLKLEDFELRIDGQPKPVSELSRADTPVRMAMLFDNSQSLREAREFEKQAAVRFFRQVMRPVDEAAIYSVTTETDNALEQPLTANVQKLARTIEGFGKPQGATPLFDAIVKAAEYLRPQQGRKVILIVSDGVETASRRFENFDEVLRRAQFADCQIYVVQTGHIENANLRDLVADRRMEQFTAQTGGAVYVPRVTSDLDTAFAQIAADLAQQYVLSYYPNDDARDGRFRVISLRVPARANLRVRARKGYYTPKG